MIKLILFSLFFSFTLFSQTNIKIRSVECKMWRGVRSELKMFTLHDNYSLLIGFETLNAFLVADHMGVAGSLGDGYKYELFVKDPKIGGFVQGASSSIIKNPLPLSDITFEDQKYNVKIRCKGR